MPDNPASGRSFRKGLLAHLILVPATPHLGYPRLGCASVVGIGAMSLIGAMAGERLQDTPEATQEPPRTPPVVP
eukprot:15447920-Alexandrium_andersonii.AAC.1